jgi:hypothetical protein
MKCYNNLKRAHDGIVVGDERTSQRSKEVVHVDNEDDSLVVEPADLAKD